MQETRETTSNTPSPERPSSVAEEGIDTDVVSTQHSRPLSQRCNVQNLVISTANNNTPAQDFDLDHVAPARNFSETSSEVPTSARLSIATTTHSSLPLVQAGQHNAHSADTISQMLDGILADPGWNVGRQRRNSLFSMRSLQPTLPPYEEYRNHAHVPLAQQTAGEGPSNGEASDGGAAEAGFGMGNEKSGRENEASEQGEDRAPSDETPAVDHESDPLNAISAHYSHIVRTIDSRYTDELARLHAEIDRLKDDHIREQARIRNEMDAKYRSELKLRDKAVEKAREEAASRSEELEQDVVRWKAKCDESFKMVEDWAAKNQEEMKEKHTVELERAKHQVEDVWERRWTDRLGLEEEEAIRRVRERDEEWLTFLHQNCPSIVDSAEATMTCSVGPETEP